MIHCLNCNKLLNYKRKKFCSNYCQREFDYKKYIKDWKVGYKNGIKGITRFGLSGHIRRFLFNKFKNKCSKCGWQKINKNTGLCPLDIHHIDGDYKNNKESNLVLLCPNCHSLTLNFKNLNKGRGRKWRISV